MSSSPAKALVSDKIRMRAARPLRRQAFFRPGMSRSAVSDEDISRAPEPAPRELERLDGLARLLDTKFSLFGIRFGLDSLLGLLPVAGDAAALTLSCYLIVQAARAGARKRTLLKMAINTGLDALLGSIPLVGDVFDFFFKANMRNMRLVRAELLRKHQEERAQDHLTLS